MRTYNIHEAKTKLSRLVQLALEGEPFIIAKFGRPLVKVVALNVPKQSQMKRFGFMRGQISVPKNFDQMGKEEVLMIFENGQ